MVESFKRLAEKASTQQLRDFVTYIDETWFNSTIYTPENLSVFKMNIRTNNDCEGMYLSFTLHNIHVYI